MSVLLNIPQLISVHNPICFPTEIPKVFLICKCSVCVSTVAGDIVLSLACVHIKQSQCVFLGWLLLVLCASNSLFTRIRCHNAANVTAHEYQLVSVNGTQGPCNWMMLELESVILSMRVLIWTALLVCSEFVCSDSWHST